MRNQDERGILMMPASALCLKQEPAGADMPVHGFSSHSNV
jgi:hypothetical protein